jgi:hypothetical protein
MHERSRSLSGSTQLYAIDSPIGGAIGRGWNNKAANANTVEVNGGQLECTPERK